MEKSFTRDTPMLVCLYDRAKCTLAMIVELSESCVDNSHDHGQISRQISPAILCVKKNTQYSSSTRVLLK